MAAAFQPHPIPWSEFPMECFIYLYLMGYVHAALFVIVCAVMAFVPSTQRRGKLRRIGRFSLFNVLLLLVGSFFNGLWSCLVWDRLYDSTDYVFDFTPFWPITQGVIDAPWGDQRGRLLGVSLFQLGLVWILFAAGTWITTAILYVLVRKLARPASVEKPAPIAAAVH